jgi:hypothetical protein
MVKLGNEDAPDSHMATQADVGATKKREKTKALKVIKRKAALTATEKQRLAQIRKACGEAGILVSTDQLLRVAISLLSAQPPASLAKEWEALAPVKKRK